MFARVRRQLSQTLCSIGLNPSPLPSHKYKISTEKRQAFDVHVFGMLVNRLKRCRPRSWHRNLINMSVTRVHVIAIYTEMLQIIGYGNSKYC